MFLALLDALDIGRESSESVHYGGLFYNDFNSAITWFCHIVPRRNNRIPLSVISEFHLIGTNAPRKKYVPDSLGAGR